MNDPARPLKRFAIWSIAAFLGLCGVAESQDASQSPAPSAPAASAPAPGAAAKKSTAQIDAGEPRADTSSAAMGDSSTPNAPAGAAPTRGLRPAASPRPAATPGKKAPAAVDRVDLSTATVTGDKEQPKVMYIVPWKKSDIGDLSGKPMNSLLDEALAPVDRDVFKREVAYYGAVKADMSQNSATKPTPAQGEK